MQHAPMVNVKDPRAAEVLCFWFGADADYGKSRKAWFEKNPEFDREIRERFLALYEQAAAGALEPWQALPGECLALMIALDQFPRNLFRGDAKAFTSDARALGAATLRQAASEMAHAPAAAGFGLVRARLSRADARRLERRLHKLMDDFRAAETPTGVPSVLAVGLWAAARRDA